MRTVSAEQRYAIYYAVLFGSIGALAPFAAVWFDEVGINAAEIGVIVAAPSVVMLITTVAIGKWADSLRDRRLAIICCNVVILFAHALLFLRADFWMVLGVWVVSGIAMYAKIPITDASALNLAQRQGTDFARIRMFGSIGFILAVSAAGVVYEQAGIGYFLWALLGTGVLRLLSAIYLPGMPCRDALNARSDDSGTLYTSAIILTLIGSALVNASHAMVNTFGILNWTQQGLSESAASLAIAIGVVVEVSIMWWFRSLSRYVSARAWLLVAAACGVVRWILLALVSSALFIFVAQALHGVTFGVMFLASATFISRRVPESAAARGQSLLAIITTACMASATFMTGQLFEAWGANIYWLMCGLCLIAMLCIAASYRYTFNE